MNVLTLEDIEERLRDIFVTVTQGRITAAQLPSGALLAGGGLSIDSVTLLEAVLRMEAEFDILLGDEVLTLQHFESLATLARTVRTEIVNQARP